MPKKTFADSLEKCVLILDDSAGKPRQGDEPISQLGSSVANMIEGLRPSWKCITPPPGVFDPLDVESVAAKVELLIRDNGVDAVVMDCLWSGDALFACKMWLRVKSLGIKIPGNLTFFISQQLRRGPFDAFWSQNPLADSSSFSLFRKDGGGELRDMVNAIIQRL